MKTLTREEVLAALGGADDVVVAEILRLRATADELAEAQNWIANDEAMINSGRSLASGRVGRLVDILATIEEEADAERR